MVDGPPARAAMGLVRIVLRLWLQGGLSIYICSVVRMDTTTAAVDDDDDRGRCAATVDGDDGQEKNSWRSKTEMDGRSFIKICMSI